NDVAIIVFGRTAGEDRDHSQQKGSYYLTDNEEKLLKQVTSKFEHTVVILNVGSVIDLSFMDQYKIDSLVLAWHGGMYGALGLVDVLTGYVTPSGKLPMTISKKLEDYPSDKTFGKPNRIFYEEDIYVGYRYFESFKKDSVRFPFGFGLSYTDFIVTPLSFDVEDKTIKFTINVKNIGEFDGKEVVQIYFEAPQGSLGKPKKVIDALS